MGARWWPFVLRSTMQISIATAVLKARMETLGETTRRLTLEHEKQDASYRRLVESSAKMQLRRDNNYLALEIRVDEYLFHGAWSEDSAYVARYLAQQVEREFATMRVIPRIER